VQVWRRPINPIIMKQFLDIISKIPLEMNWIAEGKTSNYGIIGLDGEEPELEAWMIKRVSTTNFFIAGRALAKPNENQENFSSHMSEVFEQITIKIEKALEKEWIEMAKKL
jgi:hypothetical protein